MLHYPRSSQSTALQYNSPCPPPSVVQGDCRNTDHLNNNNNYNNNNHNNNNNNNNEDDDDNNNNDNNNNNNSNNNNTMFYSYLALHHKINTLSS